MVRGWGQCGGLGISQGALRKWCQSLCFDPSQPLSRSGDRGSVRLPSLPLASRVILGQLHSITGPSRVTRTGDTWFCRCVTLNLRGVTCTSSCLVATPLSSVRGLIARKARGGRGCRGTASQGARAGVAGTRRGRARNAVSAPGPPGPSSQICPPAPSPSPRP